MEVNVYKIHFVKSPPIFSKIFPEIIRQESLEKLKNIDDKKIVDRFNTTGK